MSGLGGGRGRRRDADGKGGGARSLDGAAFMVVFVVFVVVPRRGGGVAAARRDCMRDGGALAFWGGKGKGRGIRGGFNPPCACGPQGEREQDDDKVVLVVANFLSRSRNDGRSRWPPAEQAAAVGASEADADTDADAASSAN